MIALLRQLLAASLSFLLAAPVFSNANGQLGTDTYDYDAFGNLIHSSGTTPNNYLFAGEQFDSDLNLYYNRARYLNTSTGRFWTMDKLEGDDNDPLSLHKYVYADANPVDNLDPSGNQIDDVIASFGFSNTINAISTLNYNPFAKTYRIASTVSFRGIEFIKAEEGLRTMPYNDLGKNQGNCTIGYGHLIHLGVCTQADFGQYPAGITPDAAEQLLFGDVYEKAVFPIKFLVSVPLAQKEFDALTDFTFNLGAGNSLASLQAGRGLASTTLLRVLNLGYYSAVPAEFSRFKFSGGVVIPALVRRRNDEAYQWITGIYFANGNLIP
jgi:RHS repeat-associated protein